LEESIYKGIVELVSRKCFGLEASELDDERLYTYSNIELQKIYDISGYICGYRMKNCPKISRS
jgi:hypothetical protein